MCPVRLPIVSCPLRLPLVWADRYGQQRPPLHLCFVVRLFILWAAFKTFLRLMLAEYRHRHELRDRDTTEQIRLPIAEVPAYVTAAIEDW